jgi:predicted ABC-type sugar transport system permease subunit
MMWFEKALKSLGIVMALTYVITGAVVLFQLTSILSIPEPLLTPVGLGLLTYGLFRSYRLYQKYYR